MPIVKNAQMVSVAKGSVTENEKDRVIREFESIGIQVVFLEYEKSVGVAPVIHLLVGFEPESKIEWMSTEPEPKA